MSTSRRDFFRVGLGGIAAFSLSGTVPAFVQQMAYAAENPVTGTPISNDNILVVVQLSGGNDGLNTVIPYAEPNYYNQRKVIGIKDRILKLDDKLALNPGLESFKKLYDAGKLAIVNGCGYPNPNRSHFVSMHIWHMADPTLNTRNSGGWLGHYLDHALKGSESAAIANNPLRAVNVGVELPAALVNDGAPVPSIQSIEDFAVRTDPGAPWNAKQEKDIITAVNAAAANGNPAMKFLSRQATNALVSTEEIKKVAGQYRPDANYPQNLGNQLRLIAQIISGNFGTKVFYCQVGGFDTHANQVGGHETLLRNVGDSLAAFMQDLEKKGVADKVTVMCFSEFGRRIGQNDSNGTDHGTAGPMFVLGGKVKAGLYGAYPSLTDTDNGDLKFTTDFRRVYATLLKSCLNADDAAVLNGKFDPLAFL